MRRVAWTPRRDIAPTASVREHIAAQLDDRAECATFEDDIRSNARGYSPASNRVAVLESVELLAATSPTFAQHFIDHE